MIDEAHKLPETTNVPPFAFKSHEQGDKYRYLAYKRIVCYKIMAQLTAINRLIDTRPRFSRPQTAVADSNIVTGVERNFLYF